MKLVRLMEGAGWLPAPKEGEEMPGGMRMQKDCDGYSASPEELARAEQEADDLWSLEKGLSALVLAKEWLEEGGWCIPHLTEDIGQIRLAIALLKSKED